MTTLDEIKAAIDKLSWEERAQLARWLHGWHDDEWDRQMASDISAGKLDNLLGEVDADIDRGDLKDMP